MLSPQFKYRLKSGLPGLQALLTLRGHVARSRRIRTYLTGHPIPSLHLGCGGNELPAWLNSDLIPSLSTVVPLDVTKPFPLPSASFDRIFSEHMIEHISFADARFMISECRRILRPRGILRIATPNLSQVARLVTEFSEPEQSAYLAWSRPLHSLPGPGSARAHVVNSLFYGHGHRFLYDAETLSALLTEAGFAAPTVAKPGQSVHASMQGLEHHGEVIGNERNDYETLVVEAEVSV